MLVCICHDALLASSKEKIGDTTAERKALWLQYGKWKSIIFVTKSSFWGWIEKCIGASGEFLCERQQWWLWAKLLSSTKVQTKKCNCLTLYTHTRQVQLPEFLMIILSALKGARNRCCKGYLKALSQVPWKTHLRQVRKSPSSRRSQ